MKKNLLWLLLALLVIVGGVYWYKTQDKVDDNVIKIGAILPLTGNAAGLGNYTKNGIELAVIEYNKTSSQKVELIVEDSKGDPKEGVNAISKLLLNKPKFIYSIVSGVSMAILDKVSESRTPIIGAVGAIDFLNKSDFSIRNYVEPHKIGKTIATLCLDSLKAKKIGIFYSNNDYGLSIKKAYIEELNAKKSNINFESAFDDKVLDYRNQINKISDLKSVDAIYIAGVGKSLGTLLKQLRENGYQGKIIGDLVFPYPDVINAAGNYAKGTYYLDFDFDETKDKLFFELYKNQYNDKPTNFSAIAYDATSIALKKMNASSLISEINQNQPYKGSFGVIKFENRNFIYPLKLKLYEK